MGGSPGVPPKVVREGLYIAFMKPFCIGAALGPLLAGLISPTGWNNVFYMLISADVLACLVRGLGLHRCPLGNVFCVQTGTPI